MKFIIVLALAALAVAEPPVNYGAPQAYSAPSFSSSGGYSDFGGDDGSQYVDDALLARVAQLIASSSGSSGYSSGGGGYSAPSSSYGAPSGSYGAPTRGGGGGGVLLGQPEVAQRIAEFDLTSSSGGGGYSNGGYSQGGYN